MKNILGLVYLFLQSGNCGKKGKEVTTRPASVQKIALFLKPTEHKTQLQPENTIVNAIFARQIINP